MYETTCISCFRDKGQEELCMYCGYVEPGRRKHALLPARYVLKDRYLLGEVISVDKSAICYKAMDLEKKQIVEVQEHFPREIVTRGSDGVTVVAIAPKETPWPGKSVQTLLQNAKKMMRFSDCVGIMHVYDAFEANQTVYIIDEYLEGMLLEDYLDQCGGVLDEDTAISIVLPILEGLSQLHKADLVHRAVTPKNILITSDNTIRLINFVFLKEASPFKENEMTVYFSPGYAPYEQYVSKERRGAYSDIYSVGAVLYRMLVGKPPQDAIVRKGQDTLRDSLEATDLPQYLVLCICKAMNMNKDIRFKSATEMRNALLQKSQVVDVDGQLVQARRRRNIALISALSVMLVTLIVALILVIIKYD